MNIGENIKQPRTKKQRLAGDWTAVILLIAAMVFFHFESQTAGSMTIITAVLAYVASRAWKKPVKEDERNEDL